MHKNTVKDKLETREYRNFELRIKNEDMEDDYTVEGYATTFEQPYLLYEYKDYKVYEVIDRNAFKDCDMSDVIFQYNHEGRVFARTRNKTLDLISEPHGLKAVADLGGTEIGRNLYEEIKGGYTDRMSFGFIVDEDVRTVTENDDGVTVERRITKIKKLFDVSAVSIPANDFTSISSKRFFDGAIEEAKQEIARIKELRSEKEKLKNLLKGDF